MLQFVMVRHLGLQASDGIEIRPWLGYMKMPPPSWAKNEPPTDAAPDAPTESVGKEDDARE
jgi:hypothetical protein